MGPVIQSGVIMVPCNCFEFGFSLRKEKISSFSLKKKKSSGQSSDRPHPSWPTSISWRSCSFPPPWSTLFSWFPGCQALFPPPSSQAPPQFPLPSICTRSLGELLVTCAFKFHPYTNRPTTPKFIFPAWTWPLTFSLLTYYVCMNV